MNTFEKEWAALRRRRDAASKKLETVARSIVPALMDHKLEHTAAPLKEVLFELDALDQEISDRCDKNPEAAILSLLDSVRRRKA